MTIPMTAVCAAVAIICLCFFICFFACMYHDIRSERQQKRIAKLERDLTHAEFEIERRDAVREQFEKECG